MLSTKFDRGMCLKDTTARFYMKAGEQIKHRTNMHRETLNDFSNANLLKKQALLFMQPQYYLPLYTMSCKAARLALYRDQKKPQNSKPCIFVTVFFNLFNGANFKSDKYVKSFRNKY